MSRDKTKWVSQMVSTKTRKMLEEICEKTRRSVPTELEIIVEKEYQKVKK
jgi:hypothetical protein|tara:strand:+ start:353 stop:502 length:150 start_codon:yes stop_codon:yes gene_type:complete